MEQICFELENVEVNYLDKKILDIERLAVHQFDRIGIVGRNGAGKSSLLKLLAGIVEPTSGEVSRHADFGYFEQVEAPAADEADPKLVGKLHVGPFNEGLSGGEQTRLKLAQLFTHYYPALFIDEPTTHLDQEGISFLRDELQYYYGALLLISHDRALLDELVTTIWEVDGGKVNVYSGNYSDYTARKQLERKQQNEKHEQYVKEKNQLEKAAQEKMKKAQKIADGGSKSKKDLKEKPNRMFETKSKGSSEKAIQRSAKSIEHRMEQMEEVQAVQEEKPIVFRQSKALQLHNKFPIMADMLMLHAGDKVLLEDASFQMPLGKKIAITGSNCSGKSTLLNYIARFGEDLIISPKAKIGYFKQMSYQFTTDETVLQFVQNRSEYNEGFLRSVLHSMLFTGTDIQKSVKALSGGEATRLQLCQLFLGEYNILLLDEPTNFLDIQTIEALENFITSYGGTILFVSHDRQFIANTADTQFHILDKKLKQL